MNPGPPRDAERLPWRPVDQDRAVQPRHPRVWVHVDGTWCAGMVVYWQRDADGWDAWTQHASTVYPDTAWSEHDWFRYNPETMRVRDGGEPPA